MMDLTRPSPPGYSTPHAAMVTSEGIFVLAALIALLDRPVAYWARGLDEGVRLGFEAITQLGLSDWILIPTLLVALIGLGLRLVVRPRLLRLALGEIVGLSAFVFLGTGLPGLVANIVKRLIGRARPTEIETDGVLSFIPLAHSGKYESFPSGHTTTGIAFGLVMSFLLPRGTPLFVAFGLLIGLSRIIVGQHYPTDVFGGLVLGTCGAYLVRGLFVRLGWVFRVRRDGHIVRRPLVALRRLLLRPRQA